MYIDAVRKGVVCTLIDSLAPNLIFIQVVTYLQEASYSADWRDYLAGEQPLIEMLYDLSNETQTRGSK